jgi:prepilin-type N-terminal cleavage/methylation domain-containing protein/prepilin-type processing-associated H-X9-DG protein
MMRNVPPRSSAFTLIELLVVISIIAVLAALILPVLGKVQENANSTKCTSNLRQIGVAIGSYGADNDGLLPGPLLLTQNPILTGAGDDGQLYKKLAKYFGYSETAGAVPPAERTNIFLCPSGYKASEKLTVPTYVLNPKLITSLAKPPFGITDGEAPANLDDPATSPVKRATLSNWEEMDANGVVTPVDLTRVWAMKDADQHAYDGVAVASTPPGLATTPATPVHGDYRNALFYDWHVGKLKADLTRPFELDQPK